MNSSEIKNLAKTHILHSWAVNAEIDPPLPDNKYFDRGISLRRGAQRL